MYVVSARFVNSDFNVGSEHGQHSDIVYRGDISVEMLLVST